MTTGKCRSGRKHTPIVSGRQARLFGAAYGARKAGKGKPKYVPASLWKEPASVVRAHLTEWGGKKKRARGKK